MRNYEAANAPFLDKARCRTLPIIDTVTSIPGYPQKLVIFMTNASRFWQVRCYFVPTTVIRSLLTTNKRDAIRLAKLFYDSELVKRSDVIAQRCSVRPARHDIEAAAELLLKKDQARVVRGEFTQHSQAEQQARFKRFILPFFKGIELEEIDRGKIEEFLEFLSKQNLKSTTIKAYMVVLRKTLTEAQHRGWIDRLPTFPQVKTQANPRGHFTVGEYLTLLRAAKRLRLEFQEPQALEQTHRSTRGGIYTATTGVPWEFAWLIGFMVNSFVRPVDAKVIQHKHVEIVRGEQCYLRLRLPETKRHSAQIITMPAAVHIYERLREHHAALGLAGPEDYLFLPRIQDRASATWLMDHYFGKILDATGLRLGPRGQRRTLYSLRHSAITFRLLYGEGIDLLTLARNARTSLEMVDKFYASELSAEMNVAMLHSRR
jgi:hypothetical protein